MGRLEAKLRRSAPPLGGAVCGDHELYPAFAASTSEVAVGLWPFFVLLFIIAPLIAHACSYF